MEYHVRQPPGNLDLRRRQDSLQCESLRQLFELFWRLVRVRFACVLDLRNEVRKVSGPLLRYTSCIVLVTRCIPGLFGADDNCY